MASRPLSRPTRRRWARRPGLGEVARRRVALSRGRPAPGASVAQMSWAFQQRVRNRQPDGGLAGLGTSPGEQDPVLQAAQVRLVQRHRREQGLRVRVRRRAVDVEVGALLHHAAEVHHRDAVGDVPHDRQVVGDEQVGQAEVVLQVLEQVDHLRLHRDVERGDRLVADDDLRLQGQGPGDPDALPLAAGELVRVAVDEVGVQADPVEQFLGALEPALARRDVGVHRPALGDDVTGGHPRVQRRVRVLEDDLDLAAVLLERAAAHLRDVPALVEDRPLGRLLQRDQQLRHGRLAAAGLPDQAEGLAAAAASGPRRRPRGRTRPSA